MDIKVYGRSHCKQCEFTERWLIEHQLAFKKIDVENSLTIIEQLKYHGYTSLPVVAIGDGFDNSWCGFRPDRLEELLK